MFKIFKVPDDAANATEQLGTKFKFWYVDEEGVERLYKEGRENTGENWAEKVASELCNILGIPHANYDLCEWKGKKGVTCPNFVPKEGRLVHGNELLAEIVGDYPKTQFYHVREHALRKVLTIMKSEKVLPPLDLKAENEFQSAIDVFIGYLMLDTLISNQDRHHENWGLIYFARENKQYLAPTYDHASSLGRNETDERRIQIMKSNDSRRNIINYVNRASSAFYDSSRNSKRLKSIEAFLQAAEKKPQIAIKWLNRLRDLGDQELEDLMDNIPGTDISIEAKKFAIEMLRQNKKRLLNLKGELK